jgi:signal recognition particle subunit SEC65
MPTNQLSPEERQKLSRDSSEHYEAVLFAERHPEFYPCQQNATAMIQWLEHRKLDCTFANFEKAFKALQGRLIPGAEAFEKMTAEEVRELAKKVGVEQFDEFGRSAGWDFKMPEQSWRSKKRVTAVHSLEDSIPIRPEDVGRKITRAELAQMSSQELSGWTRANGIQWDGDEAAFII